jgi:hypothetical protein
MKYAAIAALFYSQCEILWVNGSGHRAGGTMSAAAFALAGSGKGAFQLSAIHIACDPPIEITNSIARTRAERIGSTFIPSAAIIIPR